MTDYAKRKADIIARVQAGETYKSIGARWGITRERVRQIAMTNGIRSIREDLREKVCREVTPQVVALFYRGMPLAHIAETVGCSDDVVATIVTAKCNYTPAKDDRAWTAKEIDFLKTHYRAPGWSMSRIGAKLGRTRNEVAGAARRLGLQRPAPTDTKASRIRQLNASGVACEEIASRVGVSTDTVRVYLWMDANRDRVRNRQRESYARIGSV